mmetsp:Transcript_19604/g.28342  ORF Transcript_19604/g.28342 Transcript_19604/m.28342 type:complete len:235 (-) Transcript_19604:16-720(-)
MLSQLDQNRDKRRSSGWNDTNETICSSSYVSTLPPDSDTSSAPNNENHESKNVMSSPDVFDFIGPLESTTNRPRLSKMSKRMGTRKRKSASICSEQSFRKRRNKMSIHTSNKKIDGSTLNRMPRKSDEVQYLGRRMTRGSLASRPRGKRKKRESTIQRTRMKRKDEAGILPDVPVSSSLLAAVRVAQEPVWEFSKMPAKRQIHHKTPKIIKFVSKAKKFTLTKHIDSKRQHICE